MDTKNWQVKGSMLLEYVRMIRKNKDRHWDKYLTKEDMEIIEGRIMPSIWYPYETYLRAGMAIFHEITGGKIKLVWLGGRLSMERMLKEIYKGVILAGDPAKSLERFLNMRRQFFNFDIWTMQEISDKKIKITIANLVESQIAEIYASQMAGGFERLVELSEGKKPQITFQKKQWAGDNITEMDIIWE